MRGAAAKAIELDDNLAEAHTSLAWARFHDWNWAEAESEFKRAEALNASYPTAHVWYADFLASRLYYARQDRPAIEQSQKTLALDPAFVPAHLLLGRAELQTGQFTEAAAELHKALELSEGDTNELAAVAYGNAMRHEPAEARKILADLKERSQQTYVQPLAVATIYIGLGETSAAFDWLGKALEDRSAGLVYLKVDPVFDPVRSDPRFAALLQRIGLPLGK